MTPAPAPALVRVALPIPLGQAFTYAAHAPAPKRGTRVIVELGRRKVLGVIIDHSAKLPPGLPVEKLKYLESILEEQPSIPEELLDFLLELARYYIAPIGEVLRLALPALERSTAQEAEKLLQKKVKSVGRILLFARLSVDQDAEPPSAEESRQAQVSKLKGKTSELYAVLEQEGQQALSSLTSRFPSARSACKSLQKKGLIELFELEVSGDPFFLGEPERDQPPTLNRAQADAVSALCAALPNGEAKNNEVVATSAFLLDGVTASGKTEVYLHTVQTALARGLGAIVLVPEIALTPQLVDRFRARLGNCIAVWHSGLGDKARLSMWQALRSGELKVVVGARSALFSPVQNLGIICIDEEHDGSFKQEEGVRYNARDMALLRAMKADARVVLGSATPSLASEISVARGKMTRLVLPERARSGAKIPKIELIDLKRYGPGPSGDELLSLPLHRAIEETLAKNEQTILFLNRRGFAPSLVCTSCGQIVQCPHCAVALPVHKARRETLECHYCEFNVHDRGRCSECSGTEFSLEGTGTEKIEELLKKEFPNAKVERLDRDTAGGIKSEKVLNRMRAGEIDILVGTQMVTKGHDLPAVTLVGVLNADAALSLPDFRAAERTFHLLVQVAGRAGRADAEGRVFIQSRNPEHPAIAYALAHDIHSFVQHELRLREEIHYPPFSHIAMIRFDGLNEQEVRHEAARLGKLVEEQAADVEVLGPAAAPLSRLRNRYRYRFMLRSSSRKPLR